MTRKSLRTYVLFSLLSATAILPPLQGAGALEMPPETMPPDELPIVKALPGAMRPLAPLRPLPANPEAFFLQGETARLGFDVFVAAGEARTGGVLQLGLDTDISVMPEASSMSVLLNGVPVDRFSIGGSRKAPRRIALLPRVLRGGWNRVEITVEQRHRVDCSVASTYELWTRIDNRVSGLQFAAEARPTLSKLPLLPLDEEGVFVVRILGAARQPEIVETMLATAARLARAANAPSARIEFGPRPASSQQPGKEKADHPKPAGLDVYFASAAELAALGGEHDDIDPKAEELQFPKSGTATLVVDPRDHKRLVRLSDTLEAAERSVRAASTKGRAFEAQTATFRDLGFSSRDFSGRLYRGGFRLALPADAVISDYASAELTLDLGYAAGLSADSEFRVLVNGRSAAILPLGRSDGDAMTAKSLSIPLTAFRPGENHVEFEAVVSRPADRECAPGVQIEGDPRLLILETSTIRIPRLARMATLPNLAASFSGRGMDGRTLHPVRLAVTGFDDNSLSAAGTFYTRIALERADLPLPKIVDADTVITEGGTLLAAAGDVPEAMRAHLKIDDATLIELAANAARLSDLALLMSGQDIDTMTTGGIGFISTAEAQARDTTLESWRTSFTIEDDPNWLWDAVVSGTKAIASVGLGGETAPLPVDEHTSLLISQSPAKAGPGAVTLVTAPSPLDLASGVAHLVQPAQWSQLEGRAALLNGDRIETVPGYVSAMHATQPLAFGNMRLVIAAWLSMNPAIHAGLLLLAALAFGGATTVAVKRVIKDDDAIVTLGNGSRGDG
ncbi:cellulose synthase subunit [Fulvimarina manganoxydans]|uniref:Cyclic di-GMP-binding protein n=1 Tax=Fulvimarina manganoxydans TaxID=937218 RepID=A0A1W2ER56_9HYPH|nr:cellulose biosynthesis cyclic di-GMP-binding regulatory protein BcsB [Fulvimarina manganoxydans]SMD12217.1 cellulose synthase subunit [Fulvimarina manganoxydans]